LVDARVEDHVAALASDEAHACELDVAQARAEAVPQLAEPQEELRERAHVRIATAAQGRHGQPGEHRVRECDGASCTWLFLDRTKNRSRRWCDMKSCGNAAKARRHRARRRSQG